MDHYITIPYNCDLTGCVLQAFNASLFLFLTKKHQGAAGVRHLVLLLEGGCQKKRIKTRSFWLDSYTTPDLHRYIYIVELSGKETSALK